MVMNVEEDEVSIVGLKGGDGRQRSQRACGLRRKPLLLFKWVLCNAKRKNEKSR